MRERYAIPCSSGVRLVSLFLVGEVCECVSVWFWSSYVCSYVGRLPRVCLVSMKSCSLSVPSVFVGLVLFWCTFT